VEISYICIYVYFTFLQFLSSNLENMLFCVLLRLVFVSNCNARFSQLLRFSNGVVMFAYLHVHIFAFHVVVMRLVVHKETTKRAW